MIIKRVHYALIAFVAVSSLLVSERAAIADPKVDMMNSLKGEDVSGYLFSFAEEDDQTTSTLTNKTVRDVIRFDRGANGIVLRYTRLEDKQKKTVKIYKSEIKQRGKSLELVLTDLTGNNLIERRSFPNPGPNCEPTGQYDSLNACIGEFNCAHKGSLQCQANSTCSNQFAALTCCLRDGSIISVHLVIPPDNRRCKLRDLVPQMDGLVMNPG
jgi:hypothetical protein